MHHQTYVSARSLQTHQAPTQTKQLGENEDSAKLHRHHQSSKRIANERLGTIKTVNHDIITPNFVPKSVYLGLKIGGDLDDRCPNVELHRQGRDSKHPVDAEYLVRLLKEQLDENIDPCTPFGICGAYGAPFKLTCIQYGYTVVGKGTTSELWNEVSSKAQIYQILQKAQGSAVPVFLGTIDLAKIYFLHGAGAIQHMLLMGWGGNSTARMESTSQLRKEIQRSRKEIRTLGILHEDLRPENILWNEELGRALIIDFHRSGLDCRPTLKRSRQATRSCRTELLNTKRLRVL